MSLCLISMANSFHIAGPRYAKERCLYDKTFKVGIISIGFAEEERKYIDGVYTWVKPDRYVGLESVSET